MQPTIKHMNKAELLHNTKCQQLIDDIKVVEELISGFGFLQFGRDFILCDKWSFSLQSLIISIELTVGNIISCCENACVADANTLLRKFRDDLFFYLYIVVFDSRQKLEMPSDIQKMRKNISRWIQNDLNNLSIQEVLKVVGKSPQLRDVIAIYQLQKSFDAIGERLNNFVHGNGYAYYNRNIMEYKDNELFGYLKTLSDDMKYVTMSFLFLLILCSPLSIMATDYIDYLEFGETPPEDSQYWVAPFIEKFISENSDIIDENCYKYLAENTSMHFDSR